MAMAAALSSPVISRGMALDSSVGFHRRGGNPVMISESSHRRQALIGLPMNSWGMNNAFPSIKGTRTRLHAAADPGPANPPSGGEGVKEKTPSLNLPLPFPMPPWLAKNQAVINAVFGATMVAAPMYRTFRMLEDKVEQTAEVALEVIDQVAEKAEKIAEDVAEAFPENENIKQAAARVKAIADHIEADVDKAEALIDKVEEFKKEVDAVVDPVFDKLTGRTRT
ncbi:hypothetical protein U9M48_032740 [Paspalum notatum var. saurae]|uniref:Uncharacterized protein n=1 Tax=Paspalum notatum var. saurae TaxID=547442 RepID=A0AAQ3U8L6_PASNO